MMLFRSLVAVLMIFGLFRSQPQESPHVKPLAAAVKPHFDYMLKKYDAYMTSYGSGSPGGKMTHVALGFDFTDQGDFSVEKAREIMIDATTNLLAHLNASEELKPHVVNYPLNEKNVVYSLWFMNSKSGFNHQEGSGRDPNKITHCFLKDGNIRYSVDNDEKRAMVDILKEPYQDAVRIVQQ